MSLPCLFMVPSVKWLLPRLCLSLWYLQIDLTTFVSVSMVLQTDLTTFVSVSMVSTHRSYHLCVCLYGIYTQILPSLCLSLWYLQTDLTTFVSVSMVSTHSSYHVCVCLYGIYGQICWLWRQMASCTAVQLNERPAAVVTDVSAV